MFTQRQCIYCTVAVVSQCLCHTIIQDEYIHLNSLGKETERPALEAFWIFLTLAAVWKGRERLLYAESFFPTSVCQCDIHLLEAVLHKQTTPKATTGWLNNHRLFSLFSTIAHCKFLVGPQHALLRLFNK